MDRRAIPLIAAWIALQAPVARWAVGAMVREDARWNAVIAVGAVLAVVLRRPAAAGGASEDAGPHGGQAGASEAAGPHDGQAGASEDAGPHGGQAGAREAAGLPMAMGGSGALSRGRQRLAGGTRHGWPLSLALGLAVLEVALVRADLDVFAAGTGILATWALYGAFVSRETWRRALPLALLLAVALPTGPIADVYLGFPARRLVASAVSLGLRAAGVAVVPADAILVVDGAAAHVDLPCSGLKSLWTGAVLVLGLAAVDRRRADVRLLAALVVLIGAVLAANVARVATLVVLSFVLGLPHAADVVHEPLGLVGFALAVALAAGTLAWPPASRWRLQPLSWPPASRWRAEGRRRADQSRSELDSFGPEPIRVGLGAPDRRFHGAPRGVTARTNGRFREAALAEQATAATAVQVGSALVDASPARRGSGRWAAHAAAVLTLAVFARHAVAPPQPMDVRFAWSVPTEAVALSAAEAAYFAQTGAVADKERFTAGSEQPPVAGAASEAAGGHELLPVGAGGLAGPSRPLTGTFVAVASREWRAHHLPSQCAESAGADTSEARTVLVRPDLPVRVAREGEGTAIWWFQSPSRTTDELASRVWAAWTGEEDRWVLVSVRLDRPADVDDPAVRELVLTLHHDVAVALTSGEKS